MIRFVEFFPNEKFILEIAYAAVVDDAVAETYEMVEVADQ